MLFVLGLSIVVGSVIGGYLGGGGHLLVLFQPFEFVIIFGAAAGAFAVSSHISRDSWALARLPRRARK